MRDSNVVEIVESFVRRIVLLEDVNIKQTERIFKLQEIVESLQEVIESGASHESQMSVVAKLCG
jgi:hypothetical protein